LVTTLTNRDKEISDLKSENKLLAEKLYEVTAKPPISKDLKAVG
jgi:hypothetical protein